MAQGLKLIMACSEDGYLCRGPDDDMEWTGREDKRLFRLMTTAGGVMGAGSRTFDLMPTKWLGRRLIRLSTHDGGQDCSGGHRMSLGMFAHHHPGAWLLGGPTVACEALDIRLVDEVHLFHSTKVKLGGGVGVVETVLSRAEKYMESTGIQRFETLEVYTWRKKP